MSRANWIALTAVMVVGILAAMLDPDALRITRLNEGKPTRHSDLAHVEARHLAELLDEWSFRLHEIRCAVEPPAESDNTPRARACRFMQ